MNKSDAFLEKPETVLNLTEVKSLYDVSKSTGKLADLKNDYQKFISTPYGTSKVLNGRRSAKKRLLRMFGVSEELKLGDLRHHVQIYKLYNKWNLEYRSFCAGSIIAEERALTSTRCFLTNRKRIKHPYKNIKLVTGSLTTVATQPMNDTEDQQWRSIKKIYSQMFYRYPAYNLCVVVVTEPWIFNKFVHHIPLASKDSNFDGVCESVSMRPTKSWSNVKSMFREQLQMITKRHCERILLKSCRLFYCTTSIGHNVHRAFIETEGAGLVCHGTGDPAEVDSKVGLLVGVTALVNVDLPSLHNRVGIFKQWIEDAACAVTYEWRVMFFLLLINVL